MISSSYSVKYKQLQQNQIQHLKEVQQEQRGSNGFHSKKLQLETAKRRKTLAIKRKLEQAKEERRRQEILARRREEIKSATERFQRLNKNYVPKSEDEIKADLDVKKAHVGLDDALRAVRGSPNEFHRSHQSPVNNTGRFAPNKANSMHTSNNMYYQYTKKQPHGHYEYSRSNSNHSINSNNTHRKGSSASSNEDSKYVSFKPEPTSANNNYDKLQNYSLRNVTSSKSLFEQKLLNQQHLNFQEQQISLHQFNQLLDKELAKHENSKSLHEMKIGVNEDSCSTNQNHPSKVQPTTNYTNSSFMVHRSTNSPTVAVVQPNVVHRSALENSFASNQLKGSVKIYNKNNYNNSSQVDSFVQDSLEINGKSCQLDMKENSDAFTSHNFAAMKDTTTIHNTKAGSYNKGAYEEGIVNQAREAYDNQYNFASSHQDRNAIKSKWKTPSSTDINIIANLKGSTNGDREENYAQPLQTPYSGTNSSSSSTAQNSYFLHKSNANTTYNNLNYANYPSRTVNYGSSYDNESHNIEAGNKEEIQAHILQNGGTNQMSCNNNNIYSNMLHRDNEISHQQNTCSPTGETFDLNLSNVNGNLSATSPSINNYSESNSATSMLSSGGNSTEAKTYLTPAATHYEIISNFSNTTTPSHHQKSVTEQFNEMENENNNATSGTITDSTLLRSNYTTDEHSVNSTTNNSKKPPIPVPRSTVQTGGSKKIASEDTVKYWNTQNKSAGPVKNTAVMKQKITIPQSNKYKSAIPVPVSKATLQLTYDDVSKLERPKNPINGFDEDEVNDESVLTPRDDLEDISQDHTNKQSMLFNSVKGILKKPSSASLPRKTDTFGIQGESKVMNRPVRSASAHATSSAIRDSLEIRKQQNTNTTKKRRKRKMVRFVDMVYTNDSETDTDDSSGEQSMEEERDKCDDKKAVARPASAKIGSNLPMRKDMKTTSAAVAVNQQQALFFKPYPPNEPPSGRAMLNNSQIRHNETLRTENGGTPSTRTMAASGKTFKHTEGYDPTRNDGQKTLHTTATYYNGANEVKSHRSKENDVAVYDVNGIRLDRTPTDEEINCLWDTVRVCLNREESTVSSSSAQEHKSKANQFNNVQRNKYPIPQKQYEIGNGNSSGSQFKTQQRITVNPTSNYNTPTRKVNMDTLNTYSRKASLLNQRRLKEQQTNPSGVHNDQRSTVQTSVTSLGYNQPKPSGTSPAHAANTNGYEVTESMAAFLAAEQLTAKSLSEKEIENAMQAAQDRQAVINASKNTQKVPSALSVEEQRLMQSLDRLNERLKVIDPTSEMSGAKTYMETKSSAVTLPYSAQLIPRQPAYGHGGFRGHAPLTHNNHPSKRFNSSQSIINPHVLRVSSANGVINENVTYKIGYTNVKQPHFF